MKSRYAKYFHYLIKDPGSGFVVSFMILLVIGAFLLIVKKEKIAEHVANWAYLFLVIGAFIKFIQMLKD